MFYKILLTMFLAVFISACSTTSKDTADSSGSGSSGEFNTESTTSEAAAGVDTTALAVRYHVSQLITGNMQNYNDPDVWEYTNQYMENLRTAGVLK